MGIMEKLRIIGAKQCVYDSRHGGKIAYMVRWCKLGAEFISAKTAGNVVNVWTDGHAIFWETTDGKVREKRL